MKEKLKAFCRELNIEFVGISPPGPYKELELILIEREKKGHLTGLEEKDLVKRYDPSKTMPEVQSIIVCLFPYHTGHNETANIAHYAYSIDYHLIIKELLEEVGCYLSEQIIDFKYMSFVDTGPLVDRYLAYLAGLGFFGINNSFINDKYGSYVNIGYILNNYPFEPDKPLGKSCSNCGLCVKKCPGNALLGNYGMDAQKCISYITQKKGELTKGEQESLKAVGSAFGCDECQKICPHNKKAQPTPLEQFTKNPLYRIDTEELRVLTNKQFKEKFGNRAFSWRGKSILLRNLDIIEGK